VSRIWKCVWAGRGRAKAPRQWPDDMTAHEKSSRTEARAPHVGPDSRCNPARAPHAARSSVVGVMRGAKTQSYALRGLSVTFARPRGRVRQTKMRAWCKIASCRGHDEAAVQATSRAIIAGFEARSSETVATCGFRQLSKGAGGGRSASEPELRRDRCCGTNGGQSVRVIQGDAHAATPTRRCCDAGRRSRRFVLNESGGVQVLVA